MAALCRPATHRVTIDDVLALADGGAVGAATSRGRSCDRGHADDIASAFERYIGRGQPLLRAKDARAPTEVIAFVRTPGGCRCSRIPASRADELIGAGRSAGCSGIEAYHADHTPEQRATYAGMARELGLLVTGGTDYHGPQAPNPELASVDVP